MWPNGEKIVQESHFVFYDYDEELRNKSDQNYLFLDKLSETDIKYERASSSYSDPYSGTIFFFLFKNTFFFLHNFFTFNV